jgi:hemerythrin-like domain-containing protein
MRSTRATRLGAKRLRTARRLSARGASCAQRRARSITDTGAFMTTREGTQRRDVLIASAVAAGAVLAGCKGGGNREGAEEGKNGDEVTPAEDLMREHGILSRLLLIYDDATLRLETGGMDVDPGVLLQASDIVKSFVEDYHERLEEDFLFPRFERANVNKELVILLRVQHGVGRRVTAEIHALSSGPRLTAASDRRELASALRRFTRMYRPHAAREDTVLFPSLHKVLTPSEYDSMGDEFEKRERELFGQDGFEGMVAKVAALERQVGLFDLAQFTPT